jgi:ABC-type sugar transport system permease subunit
MDFQEERKDENKTNNADINKLSMDNNGSIRNNQNDAVISTENTKLFTVLGWISTGLAAFVSPIFAIGGIVFGVLLNKKIKGRGNIIIIASVVLGTAKFILSYLFLSIYR